MNRFSLYWGTPLHSLPQTHTIDINYIAKLHDKQSDKSTELLELLFATEDKVSPDNQSKGKIMLTETNHRSIFLPLLCFPPFLWHYVKWIINQTLDSEFWIIRLIFPSIWCLFCLRYDEKPRYELCDWWERESSVSNKILTRCWRRMFVY